MSQGEFSSPLTRDTICRVSDICRFPSGASAEQRAKPSRAGSEFARLYNRGPFKGRAKSRTLQFSKQRTPAVWAM